MSEPRHKFYKSAEAVARTDGFGVALDARALRTPGGAPFVLPTQALAAACAREWDAQEKTIRPHTMPLTRLANVAIDRTPATRQALAGHIGSYAETDLVSHRAERPASLIAKQAHAWDPLIGWMQGELGVRLPVVTGVNAAPVEEAMRRRVEDLAAALDDFRLTALGHAAGLAGSAAIAFALMRGRLDGRTAFEAACLDDLFSLETWGDDEAARDRLGAIYLEFLALQRFFGALA
jgi:chaperone required for assembly of F1-ATPase